MKIERKRGITGIRIVEHNKTLFWIIICLIILLVGITVYLAINKSDKNSAENAQIANPASVNCIDNGGELEMRTDSSGGEYGVCKLNGKECEEWAYFRGECKL